MHHFLFFSHARFRTRHRLKCQAWILIFVHIYMCYYLYTYMCIYSSIPDHMTSIWSCIISIFQLSIHAILYIDIILYITTTVMPKIKNVFPGQYVPFLKFSYNFLEKVDTVEFRTQWKTLVAQHNRLSIDPLSWQVLDAKLSH